MKVLKKKKKLFWFIVCPVIIVSLICYLYFSLLFFIGYHKHYVLSRLTEEIIGVPDTHMLVGDYKKLNISEEEWNNPVCEPMYYYDKFKKGELAPLKRCIFITVESPIQKPFCNFFSADYCIAVSLHEYTINRPDILKQIIEVIKKPCNFFPDIEPYSDKIRVHYNKYKTAYDTEESYLKGHLINYNQNLRSLQCNKPVGSRKLETIILNFIDSNKQRQFQMIVKREE